MALAADGRAPRVDVAEVSTAGVWMLSEPQYCLRVSKGIVYIYILAVYIYII